MDGEKSGKVKSRVVRLRKSRQSGHLPEIRDFCCQPLCPAVADVGDTTITFMSRMFQGSSRYDHGTRIEKVAFTADGLYAAFIDGRSLHVLKYCTPGKGKEPELVWSSKHHHDKWPTALAVSLTGKYVVTGSFDGDVILYDLETKASRKVVVGRPHREQCYVTGAVFASMLGVAFTIQHSRVMVHCFDKTAVPKPKRHLRPDKMESNKSKRSCRRDYLRFDVSTTDSEYCVPSSSEPSRPSSPVSSTSAKPQPLHQLLPSATRGSADNGGHHQATTDSTPDSTAGPDPSTWQTVDITAQLFPPSQFRRVDLSLTHIDTTRCGTTLVIAERDTGVHIFTRKTGHADWRPTSRLRQRPVPSPTRRYLPSSVPFALQYQHAHVIRAKDHAGFSGDLSDMCLSESGTTLLLTQGNAIFVFVGGRLHCTMRPPVSSKSKAKASATGKAPARQRLYFARFLEHSTIFTSVTKKQINLHMLTANGDRV